MNTNNGYCECGCGELTPIITKTQTKRGRVKGEPQRLIFGHRKRFCKRGHLRSPENVSKDGHCKPCHAFTDKCREGYQEAKRKANRKYDQRRVYTDTRRLTFANKNARRRGAVGNVTVEEWRAICAITNDCCACCGLDRQILWTMKRVLAVDHIIPISVGGNNTADNAQPLCDGRRGGVGACNQVKGAKTINYLTKWLGQNAMATAA